MPKLFATENASGSPSTSLWITNGLVQIFLLVTLYANSTYQALFYIASTAILVPYVFSGGYALKLALTGESYKAGEARMGGILVGLIATIYGAWLVYAAGPKYLFMCALLYAPGIVFYAMARRETKARVFHPVEALIAVGLVVAGIAAAYDGYHASLGGSAPPSEDGLSADQQFFIAFAQNYAGKMREAALRQEVATDSHSPDEFRASTVRNIDAWYPAFDVQPGQKLYLAPADRVRIW